jgi:hypothetical protein
MTANRQPAFSQRAALSAAATSASVPQGRPKIAQRFIAWDQRTKSNPQPRQGAEEFLEAKPRSVGVSLLAPQVAIRAARRRAALSAAATSASVPQGRPKIAQRFIAWDQRTKSNPQPRQGAEEFLEAKPRSVGVSLLAPQVAIRAARRRAALSAAATSASVPQGRPKIAQRFIAWDQRTKSNPQPRQGAEEFLEAKPVPPAPISIFHLPSISPFTR